MERTPRPGEIYRHFKGDLYRVVTLAEHTESGETLVVYQALYGSFSVYARPLEQFAGRVDKRKYPQAESTYRFTLVPEAGPLLTAGNAAQETAETAAEAPVSPKEEGKQEDFSLDPGLLAFLDADTYEKKLEMFVSLGARADAAMLNTIAASLELELAEGSLEEQYETLKSCLLTLEKYECNRLR